MTRSNRNLSQVLKLLITFLAVAILTSFSLSNQMTILAFPSTNPSPQQVESQTEGSDPVQLTQEESGQSPSQTLRDNYNSTGGPLEQLGEALVRLFGDSSNQ